MCSISSRHTQNPGGLARLCQDTDTERATCTRLVNKCRLRALLRPRHRQSPRAKQTWPDDIRQVFRPPHPGADEISVSCRARATRDPMWHRISARTSEVAPNPSAVAHHREATLLQTGPHSVDAMSGQRTSILLSSSPSNQPPLAGLM
jgi:hypothetical protein